MRESLVLRDARLGSLVRGRFAAPSWWRPPARTVPVTRWHAPSLWRARPITVLVLVGGLWLFGTGEALLVQSALGVSPWTVLAEGVGERTSWGVGVATFVISVGVLALWWPLRVRPGLGTVANAVVIATALGVGVVILPVSPSWPLGVLSVLTGIGLIGLGSGLYLTVGMGPGPRDGLMTGLHRRTGRPVSIVRAAIEVTVLAAGWALGGTVGVGTVMFALLVGPSVGYGLAFAARLGRIGSVPE